MILTVENIENLTSSNGIPETNYCIILIYRCPRVIVVPVRPIPALQ
jgi:hypothetical protein